MNGRYRMMLGMIGMILIGLFVAGCGGGGGGGTEEPPITRGPICAQCTSSRDCLENRPCENFDDGTARCAGSDVNSCPALASLSSISSDDLFADGHCLECNSDADCLGNLTCELFDDRISRCSAEATECTLVSVPRVESNDN